MEQKYFESEYEVLDTALQLVHGSKVGDDGVSLALGNHKFQLTKAWLDWGVPTATKGTYGQRRMKVLSKVMDKASKIRNAGSLKVTRVRDSDDRAKTPYNIIGRQGWDHHTNMPSAEVPHKAFKDALASGVLTRATVGDYMYMYTDKAKGDAFKNKWTKEYTYNK